ncbi:MAG: hypothetical protein ABJM29_10470 [Rhizobiaceae bacterium]
MVDPSRGDHLPSRREKKGLIMYRPNFTDPTLSILLRKRGIIAADQEFPSVLRKFFDCVQKYELMTGEEKWMAWEHLQSGKMMPATQLIVGATQPKKSLGSCTVINCDTEQLDRTFDLLEKRSIMGEGVGIDLSNTSDPLATALAINKHAKRLSDELIQKNERPPALMLSCSSGHGLVEQFCMLKNDAAPKDWVANISVKIEREAHLKRLLPTISAGIHKNGEPGVLFNHNIERSNPNPEIPYVSTAPCAEALLATDEQCIFVTVNIAAHVCNGYIDFVSFAKSCRVAALVANAMIDSTQELSDTTKYKRKIGIGVCGFHTALIYLRLPYATSEKLCGDIAEVLSFESKLASLHIAQRSAPYPGFSVSRWNEHLWREAKYKPTSGKVPAPYWRKLMAQIGSCGLANSSTVCFPPTGVSSDILGVSKSYEPHFTLTNRQGIASSRVEKTPHEVSWANANGVSQNVLRTALEITPVEHLKIHEAFSRWSDDSASKTINLPCSTTAQEISALVADAWKSEMKGLTMFREGCYHG